MFHSAILPLNLIFILAILILRVTSYSCIKDGNVYITSQNQSLLEDCLATSTLTISTSTTGDITTFPPKIGGNLIASGIQHEGFTSIIDETGLRNIDFTLVVEDNPYLESVVLLSLLATGGIQISNNSALVNIDLGALEDIAYEVDISGAIKTLDVSSIRSLSSLFSFNTSDNFDCSVFGSWWNTNVTRSPYYCQAANSSEFWTGDPGDSGGSGNISVTALPTIAPSKSSSAGTSKLTSLPTATPAPSGTGTGFTKESAEILGGVIGALVAVGLVSAILLIGLRLRRRKQRRAREEYAEPARGIPSSSSSSSLAEDQANFPVVSGPDPASSSSMAGKQMLEPLAGSTSSTLLSGEQQDRDVITGTLSSSDAPLSSKDEEKTDFDSIPPPPSSRDEEKRDSGTITGALTPSSWMATAQTGRGTRDLTPATFDLGTENFLKELLAEKANLDAMIEEGDLEGDEALAVALQRRDLLKDALGNISSSDSATSSATASVPSSVSASRSTSPLSMAEQGAGQHSLKSAGWRKVWAKLQSKPSLVKSIPEEGVYQDMPEIASS